MSRVARILPILVLSIAAAFLRQEDARACASMPEFTPLSLSHPDLPLDGFAAGRLGLLQPSYARSYLDWLAEKRDWCISRQLWWGHRIPIWYTSAPEAELKRAFGDRATAQTTAVRTSVDTRVGFTARPGPDLADAVRRTGRFGRFGRFGRAGPQRAPGRAAPRPGRSR